MNAERRFLLRAGGGVLAALCLPSRPGTAEAAVDIEMSGDRDGAHVWFDPVGVRISPGQTVRWLNRDRGNSHSATAYHPENFGRALRIPAAAPPWDSGYLLPQESFSVRLLERGVYDYYCIPHEQSGMVGRIVVGEPNSGELPREGHMGELPEAARAAFPTVEEIMRKGYVRRS